MNILVSDHAVRAYRQRTSTWKSFHVLEREISNCIKRALKAGRELDHKPEGFVLYGRKSNRLPAGQRFVQCTDDYGFILKPIEGDTHVVVTMITRAGVRR